MAYSIAIANGKGGVGKTTTTLSLGGALAVQGFRVLLIDLDPHGNLTLSLGITPSDLPQSVTDILLANHELASVIQPTEIENLNLVGANSELNLAERFLTLREDFEQILRDSMQENGDYDLILMDCPPALGPLTLSALTAANLLIIPTQCEYYSAHALRDILNQVRNTRYKSNPNLRYRLLLTMLDRRNRIHRTLSNQIRNAFGRATFTTMIEMDTRLRESPVFGSPISNYAPSSRGAQQYRTLAQELMRYAEESLQKSSRPA